MYDRLRGQAVGHDSHHIDVLLQLGVSEEARCDNDRRVARLGVPSLRIRTNLVRLYLVVSVVFESLNECLYDLVVLVLTRLRRAMGWLLGRDRVVGRLTHEKLDKREYSLEALRI